MKTEIEQMFAKIEKLEKQVKALSDVAEKFDSNLNLVKTKDFLNFSCVEETKLKIATLEIVKNESLLFECILQLFSPSEQEIEYGLVIGDIMVGKIKTEVSVGKNEITITQDFLPMETEAIEIFIIIKSLLNKQIVLEKCTLNIWGAKNQGMGEKYNVLDMNENYLLSLIRDDNLYYKIITKNEVGLNAIDFEFCAKVSDFSFAYLKTGEVIYLCRIDKDGNLFIDNFKTKKSQFIASEVSYVGSVASDNEVFVCYIKDSKCISFFIEENIISEKFNIGYNYIIKKCSAYYNKYSDSFFLVLKLFDDKNIMIESISSLQSKAENIKASYSIRITTYEVEDEN